ncbi:MAG: cupin domain-containing protein [Pseudonocardia sp.]
MSTIATLPYARAATVENSTWYFGHVFSFLAGAADTGGSLSVTEIRIYQGGEPPMHVHHGEDEAFYVLDGHISYLIGDERHEAPAGTFVWLPREIPHGFRCRTESARVLCLMAPGGAEQEFRDTGSPAQAMTFGPIPEEPPDPELLARDAARYNYDVVGPPVT